jgi:NAD-dependent dihydropyrimidine dehydrogenase PreA subunit
VIIFENLSGYRSRGGNGMEIKSHRSLLEVLSSGVVVTEPSRCVQCGICSFNCPAGIDIRKCAWNGDANRDNHCLACGQCVSRCPRGVPRFEKKSNPKKVNQVAPNRETKHNYVIIGTGPAGVSAAESIRELEPESEVTLVGDEGSGFYSRPGLAT